MKLHFDAITDPVSMWPRRSSANERQGFELVERRRRGQSPFERGCALAPGIARRCLLAHKRTDHCIEEDQQAEREDVGAYRGHVIPTREGIRIVGDAPRHSGQSEEVLREEDELAPMKASQKCSLPRKSE